MEREEISRISVVFFSVLNRLSCETIKRQPKILFYRHFKKASAIVSACKEDAHRHQLLSRRTVRYQTVKSILSVTRLYTHFYRPREEGSSSPPPTHTHTPFI